MELVVLSQGEGDWNRRLDQWEAGPKMAGVEVVDNKELRRRA